LVPDDPALPNRTTLFDPHRTAFGGVMGRLAFTERTLREERLFNMTAALRPRTSAEAAPNLWTPLGLTHHVLQHLHSMAHKADAEPRRPISHFDLHINFEQSPALDNRVALGSERDALGQPKVQIFWRWTQADCANRERTLALLAREVERAGLGRIVSVPGVALDPNAHHHMGTTRMHRDPRRGVVNENARVHGLANLFVAGSSLFPTGGVANPTLTIVALALRLADQLVPLLGARAAVAKSAAGTANQVS
jgi:choline dehydrogenase-like flavoprotein